MEEAIHLVMDQLGCGERESKKERGKEIETERDNWNGP